MINFFVNFWLNFLRSIIINQLYKLNNFIINKNSTLRYNENFIFILLKKMTFKIYHKLIKIERNCYKSYSNFTIHFHITLKKVSNLL